MIVHLAEIICYCCNVAQESTRSEIPRTQEDYEQEFKRTFHYKKVKRDGGEVWLCLQCQHHTNKEKDPCLRN